MTAFMFTTYHRSRIDYDYEYRFAEYDYEMQVHQ